ncbi:LuxR C-terminal-related transcriptional regulator [Aureisphaera galaxeae]|uniref:tetratricopeptide repeat protein n=1 Tax=Aureisphaera galaxeae TaxID=1538023 RepID=UPI0023506148|nr:tetratricopeptide repeat protein [Aureisphaera galaxeae]MDC8003395.1 LuxR C-terminal-related transcriptional regulator [Aureisphaera galaxeae]
MTRSLLLTLFVLVHTFTIAQDDISSAKRTLEKNSQSNEVVNALKEIITYYGRVSPNADSTFIYSKRLEDIARSQKDSLLFAEAYLGYSRYHYIQSNLDSVIDYSGRAIGIFDRYAVKERKAATQIVLGNAHFLLYNDYEALSVLTSAAPHTVSIDRILVNVSLGLVSTQTNDFESAIFYFNEAYKISNELQNDTYLYEIYSGQSVIQTRTGDNEAAKASLKNALLIAEKQEYFMGQAMSLHNMGLLHYRKGDYGKAKSCYDKTIDLFSKIDSPYMKGSLYRSYADMLVDMDKIEEAQYYVEMCETIFEHSSPAKLCYSEALRGRIARKLERPKEGLDRFHKAIEIAEENGISEVLTHSYMEISQIHESLGNYSASLAYFKEYERFKDSISKLNKTRDIEGLKMQFDIAQYEQDLLVKDQKLAILDSKQKASNYRNVLFGFLAFGMLLFVYRQRKINKMNKAAFETEKELSRLKEAQIDHSKKEITEYAIHINEYNKLLDTCLSKIRFLKRSTKEDSVKSGLTELQFYIKDKTEVNKEKVALDMKVKNEQEDFTFNLKSKFPDLSQKEIQVAIYTILNMTSKQAAHQMGIKEQSVYNYRLTLRKKLGLSKDTNLSNFLKEL